jgi:hypothetical protein
MTAQAQTPKNDADTDAAEEYDDDEAVYAEDDHDAHNAVGD